VDLLKIYKNNIFYFKNYFKYKYIKTI